MKGAGRSRVGRRLEGALRSVIDVQEFAGVTELSRILNGVKLIIADVGSAGGPRIDGSHISASAPSTLSIPRSAAQSQIRRPVFIFLSVSGQRQKRESYESLSSPLHPPSSS